MIRCINKHSLILFCDNVKHLPWWYCFQDLYYILCLYFSALVLLLHCLEWAAAGLGFYVNTNKTEYFLTCTCIGFHPGRVEPASSQTSTASRTIAAHVRGSWARSHKMASQSWFHHQRPTTCGPDTAARSSLIVLAHVFSCLPARFHQLGREVGRSTSWMSSPSAVFCLSRLNNDAVWSFTCVLTYDGCLIELLVIHSST